MKKLKKIWLLFLAPIIMLSLYIIWWIVYGALVMNNIDIPPQVVLQTSLIPVYSIGLFIAPVTYLVRSTRKSIKHGANKFARK